MTHNQQIKAAFIATYGKIGEMLEEDDWLAWFAIFAAGWLAAKAAPVQDDFAAPVVNLAWVVNCGHRNLVGVYASKMAAYHAARKRYKELILEYWDLNADDASQRHYYGGLYFWQVETVEVQDD